MRRGFILAVAASIAVLTAIPSNAAGTDVRLTHDEEAPGYVSAYTLATGQAYSDDVLDECSVSRGRQNEPAVGVDPRNTQVLIGSANDYCGTYAGTSEENNFGQPGPIWLGYYRSENGGQSFVSSLVPDTLGTSRRSPISPTSEPPHRVTPWSRGMTRAASSSVRSPPTTQREP